MYKPTTKFTIFKKSEAVLIILTIVLFWYLNTYNYILFHTSIEMFTIVISFSLFLIGISTSKFYSNSILTHFSLIYGSISIINFIYILTYMNIIIYSCNINTLIQLFILSKYYEIIALLFSVYFFNKKFTIRKIFLVNFIILIVSLSSIFIFNIFPTCYIPSNGYTNYKNMSQIIIVCIYMLIIYILNNNAYANNNLSRNTLNLFNISFIFKVLSEVFFIFTNNIYNNFNFLSDITRFLSFYVIYKIIIITVITDPFNNMFKELNKKANDLKKANETITKKTLKYRTILDFLPLGIVKKENDTIVFVNKVFTEMFNINANDKISTNNFINSLYSNKLLMTNDSKELKSLDSHIEKEFLINNKKIIADISTFNFVKPWVNSTTFVIRDISYKKREEEIISKLKEKEKEDTLKADFFTNISHELKTPINVIYTALQMENILLENKDISKIKKYNSIINQNCFRLIRIVNNLIDTTKISSNFMHPNLTVANIVEVIENITQSVMLHPKYNYINLIFDTDKEDIYIYCDITYIERIILNLLSNSIKYSDNGCNITVSLHSKETGKVSIIVEDKGIGIPDDKKEKIFNKFEKIDKSLIRKNEGSGMGLHIVKSLVELLNGSITLESSISKGSKFFITFPTVEICDELCATIDGSVNRQTYNITEKINIEFSDIY
ncbi:sensor histidine kinase [Clostridium sp. DL1XJH146]